MEGLKAEELISVVVPAYNHEKYLADCLNSIADQVHQNIELLVIDDGSSDRTNTVIVERFESFPDRFQRLVHISRANKGKAATLNELIQLARADYIFLLDSDDVAKPEAISTLYAILSDKPQYALAVGDNEIIDAAGRRVFWDHDRHNVPEGPDVEYRTFGEFLRYIHPEIDFTSENFGAPRTFIRGNYVPNGQLFRTAALHAVGGYREHTLEDWYINSKLAARYKLAYVDEILVSYRWHDDNTIKDKAYMAELTAETRSSLERDWYPRTHRLRAVIRKTRIAEVRRRLRSSKRSTRI